MEERSCRGTGRQEQEAVLPRADDENAQMLHRGARRIIDGEGAVMEVKRADALERGAPSLVQTDLPGAGSAAP